MADFLKPEEFDKLFVSFRDNVFRLESLDKYLVDSEKADFDAFKSGGPRPAGFNSEWTDLVSMNARSGRTVQRLRVTSVPVPEYVRFETDWGYPLDAGAGEIIKMIARHDMPNKGRGLDDFLLFDNADAVKLHYDRQGRFLGGGIIVDKKTIARYRDIRDAAWEHSVPFQEFMQQQNAIAIDL